MVRDSARAPALLLFYMNIIVEIAYTVEFRSIRMSQVTPISENPCNIFFLDLSDFFRNFFFIKMSHVNGLRIDRNCTVYASLPRIHYAYFSLGSLNGAGSESVIR